MSIVGHLGFIKKTLIDHLELDHPQIKCIFKIIFLAKNKDVKKLTCLSVLIIVIVCLQNCSEENEPLTPLSEIVYWTQEKLDENENRLLEIDRIEGDVYISNVTDLSAFKNLRFIDGDLRIQYTDLENLEDLSNLEMVENLKIDENPNLTLLELKNLKVVKRNIAILTNVGLEAINFPKLEKLGTSDENGLWQNGNIDVMDNNELLTVSVSSLQEYNGIGIQRNDKFTTLNGLTSPSESSYFFHTIWLEFDEMDCPPTLLEHLNHESAFRIKIKNVEESKFEWLENIQHGSSFNFYGDFVPEDLCILKEIILDYPSLLEVFQYDSTINVSFNGFELIENCQ